MYDKKPPIRITIDGVAESGNMVITMNTYSSIQEYIDAFKVILTYQGFHPATIAEWLDNEDEEVDYV